MTRPFRSPPQSILLLTLVTILTVPTVQAQVVLKTKPQPETKRLYHVETSTKQLLTLNGMDIETQSSQFIISEHTTGARGDDGTLRMTDLTRKLQQELKLPGITLEFDSDNPDKKAPVAQLEPILDLLRVISKARYTVVFDKSNQVVKIEGADEALKDLTPDLRKALAGQIGADVLLERAKNQFQRIPAKAVRVGEQWEHTTVMQLEAGQELSIKRQYTYAGTTKQGQDTLHRITTRSLEVTLTQDPPEGSPTKITDSKLKIAKGTGEILIDLKRGVIVSDSDTTRMTGSLTMEINGMSFAGKLDLTIASKLQLQK